MPGSWPKNGLFIVRAENGKYWAETLDPNLLGEGPCKDRVPPWERHDLFENFIQPALDSLQQQIAESRMKEIKQICKRVVHEKAKAN